MPILLTEIVKCRNCKRKKKISHENNSLLAYFPTFLMSPVETAELFLADLSSKEKINI